jgi:hypothetical protein
MLRVVVVVLCALFAACAVLWGAMFLDMVSSPLTEQDIRLGASVELARWRPAVYALFGAGLAGLFAAVQAWRYRGRQATLVLLVAGAVSVVVLPALWAMTGLTLVVLPTVTAALAYRLRPASAVPVG